MSRAPRILAIHKRRRAEEQGAVTMFVALFVAFVLAGLIGLVYDGGRVLDTREADDRAAGQAARAGADQISAAGIRNGLNNVSASQARTAALNYLAAAGLSGTVTVNGQVVTVTVTGSVTPIFLGAFGMPDIHISETESAQGIQGGP